MRQHPDLDQLALHALGEDVLDRASQEHVASCPGCTATVAELAGTVRTVRGPVPSDVPAVPVPAHVWQAISAELGLAPGVRPRSVGPSRLPRLTGQGAEPSTGPLDRARHVDLPTEPVLAGVVALSGHRRRAPGRRSLAVRVLAVAAAGLAVGAAGSAVLVPRVGGPDSPAPVALAAAELEPFGAGEGTDVAGSARLSATPSTGDGDRVLQVWLDDMPDPEDGYFEAWLIDPGTGAMVSLGAVRTDVPGAVTADLTVPPGVDVGTYAVVDVSAEPLDGDPAHSGVSLVRGTLDT